MSDSPCQRRPRSERERELLRLSERYMACGIRGVSISPEYQIVISRAEGARIYDL